MKTTELGRHSLLSPVGLETLPEQDERASEAGGHAIVTDNSPMSG